MADDYSMRVMAISPPDRGAEGGGGGWVPAERYQHCTFCKNHGVVMRRNGHACQHRVCECVLCRLTQVSQIAMRHQQAIWRHQCRQMARNKNFQMHGFSARQLCDKCRNHGELVMKRGHKSKCLYESCKCPLCNLTDKRRLLMKHQQRVRRANVTAHAISSSDEDGTDSNPEGENADDDESVDLREDYQENAYHKELDSYAVESAINVVTEAIKQLPLSPRTAGKRRWISKL